MVRYELWLKFMFILDFLSNDNIIIIAVYFFFSWIKSVFIYGYMIVIGYAIIFFYLSNNSYFQKKKIDSLTEICKFSVNHKIISNFMWKQKQV